MQDPQSVTPSKYLWGLSHFLDYEPEGTRTIRNFFVSEMEMVARYAVPYIKNMDLLMQDSEEAKKKSENEPKVDTTKTG